MVIFGRNKGSQQQNLVYISLSQFNESGLILETLCDLTWGKMTWLQHWKVQSSEISNKPWNETLCKCDIIQDLKKNHFCFDRRKDGL